MASQKGGGASFGLMIGLIVAIFLYIPLIYLAAYHAEVKKVTDAQAEREEADRKLVEVKRELAEVYNLVHGSTQPLDREKVTRDYLKAAGARLAEALAQEQISSEEFAKNLHKDGKLAPKDYKNLLEVYNDLFVELGASIPELNRLRLEKAQALSELETARGSARKEKAEIETSLEKERKEKGELNAKLLEDAKTFDAEKRRLLEEKEQIGKELAKKEEERLIAEAKLESEISRLEGRIVELTEKRKRSLADTDADGEIVHADQRLGLAWINLGQNHRLRRGTTFDVFQYVKGGVKKSKGKVEVKSLEDDMAQVAITQQTDASDPIVKGDHIASPFYDGKKAMVFVFVGEKLGQQSRYNMEELVRRIEEHGGRVDKTVTIDTDFIVAIESAEQSEEFQKAVQFGVVIMREAELLEYLGR
jgi:hypothetical protein